MYYWTDQSWSNAHWLCKERKLTNALSDQISFIHSKLATRIDGGKWKKADWSFFFFSFHTLNENNQTASQYKYKTNKRVLWRWTIFHEVFFETWCAHVHPLIEHISPESLFLVYNYHCFAFRSFFLLDRSKESFSKVNRWHRHYFDGKTFFA